MCIVRFFRRFWDALLGRSEHGRKGIDSHKWESKMQVLHTLSRRHD